MIVLVIPWIPASKKNQVRVAPIRIRGQVIHRPVPSTQVLAEEHAIGVLFSAQRALQERQIDAERFQEIRDLCIRRASRREGIGSRRLSEQDPGAQDPWIPEGHDVAMELEIVIGQKAGDDRSVVRVQDLGPRRKRRRSGRRRDAINLPAIVADALKGRAFPDDRDIVDLRVRVSYDA